MNSHIFQKSTFGIFLTCLAIFAILCSDSLAQDQWKENVDDALKKSADDKKIVVILFTGTDWCPPCMKLEEEVFSKKEFQDEAGDTYHLVKLDFPRAKERKKHNETWSKKLAISGFPSVVLVDKQGRPFAKTGGYQAGGPKAYLEKLEEMAKVLVTRDAAFAKAEKASGGEKAKLLDEAIASLPEEYITDHYEDVIKEIVALDAKDKLGLRTKYYAAQDKEARKLLLAKVSMASRTLSGEKALSVIDQALNEMSLPPMMKIEAMQFKLRVLRKIKESDQAAKLLDEMIGLKGVDAEVQNRLIVQKAYLLVSAKASGQALGLLDEYIGQKINNIELFIAKGELLDRVGKHDEAIEAFDEAIISVRGDSERIAEIISLKSEALVAQGRTDDALTLLDLFAGNEKHPYFLRADCLVQKSVLLRDQGRSEEAEKVEQEALLMIEDPDERADLAKYIETLKRLEN